MEIAAKLPKPSPIPKFFHSRTSVFASKSNSVPIYTPNNKTNFLSQNIQGLKLKPKNFENLRVVFSNSEAQTPSTNVADRWLLQPVG